MAAIQDSSFWREVDAVFASEAKPIAFTLEVTLHANGQDIAPLQVIDESAYRNFIQNHTDEIAMSMVFSLGTFEYDVIPYKTNLEVTVRRIPLLEKLTPVKDNNQQILSYRYRALLFDNKSDAKEGNNPAVFNKEIADRADLKTVRMQLVDPIYEQLRTNTVGTVMHDVCGANAIRAILGSQSATPRKDQSMSVLGVTLAPGFRTVKQDHIVLRDNTPVLRVPDEIDRVCGGVYSSGLGYYLLNQFWYVYSPYDVTVYDRAYKTLTLINIPANRIVSPERSYRETPTQAVILITGKVVHDDKSEQRLLNDGNGVRFVDARKVMEGFGTAGDNKFVVSSKENVNEIVVQRRASGVDYVPESAQRFTANYQHEYAKMAVRSGSLLHMVWENSNDSILYPGMPVKYMYMKDQLPYAVQGILVGVESYSSVTNKSAGSRRFTATTALTIFVGEDL